MNEVEIIQYAQVPGLKMFFNVVNYRTMHQHEEMEVIWVLDHPLTISCAGQEFNVPPGEVFIFNPSELHELRSESGTTTFLCMQFHTDALSSSYQLRHLVFDSHLPFDYLSDTEITEARMYLLDIMRVYLYGNEGYELYCTCRAGLLLYQLLQAVPHHTLTPHEASSQKKLNERIERLMEYVDENYTHKITLSEFAEQENCSMTYLSHLIKTTLNQSFQEYVTSRRLQAAIEMIQQTDFRLIDISMEAGFSDYRYFCAAFRARFNLSPEEYRRTYSGAEMASTTTIKLSKKRGGSKETILNTSQSMKLLQRLCE